MSDAKQPAASVEIEVSQSRTESVSKVNAATVQPRMTRDDAAPKLKGGGFVFVDGIPLRSDDNFCRWRCCCVDGMTTILLLEPPPLVLLLC
jgi:hypothetical protein